MPREAQISCATERDCPPGYVCNTAASLCVQPGTAAPTIALSKIGGEDRGLDAVSIGLAVGSVGNGSLSFSLEVATDCSGSGSWSPWWPGTISDGQQAILPEAGGDWALTWDALADASSQEHELSPNQLDTDGDDIVDREVVTYCAQAKVRIRASDTEGRQSNWVESGAFALGNTAPQLVRVAVLGEQASGNTIVRVWLHDVAADPLDIVAFDVLPDNALPISVDPGSALDFPLGGCAAIASSSDSELERIVPHDFLWDSRAAVKANLESVRLRLRVRDSLGAISAAQESAPFAITNAPPSIDALEVHPAAAGQLGPEGWQGGEVDNEDVTLCFRLTDPDAVVTVAIGIDDVDPVPAYIREAPATSDGKECLAWDRTQAGYAVSDIRLSLTPLGAGGEGATVSVSFRLDNRPKAVPSILDLRVQLPTQGVAGPAIIPVTYRLVDPAGDVAAIEPEYSLDGGLTWAAAREYPAAESNGTEGLATAPLGLTPEQGGLRYQFLWDATAIAWRPQQARFRMRARDGRDPGEFVVDVELPGTMGSSHVMHLATEIPLPNNLNAVTAADFNADKVTDVAVMNGDEIAVFLGQGEGTLGAPVPLTLSANAGVTGLALTAGDFNGDHVLDLASANGYDVSPGSITLFYGVGNGSFASGVELATSRDPTSIVAGDFNGDGVSDIAVTPYWADKVEVFLSQSNGAGGYTLAGPQSFAVGTRPTSLATGDFDGDGILDLATANYLAGSVSVLLGQGTGVGDGTFAPCADYDVGSSAQALVVEDFDGDGVSDLAVVVLLDNSVTLLFGAGDGTFAAGGEYALAGAPKAVAAADFNGDGIADLAATSASPFAISILLGQGAGRVANGTLAPRVDYSLTVSPSALTARDLNGDGVTDLAVGASGKLALFFGQDAGGAGNGSFAAKVDSFVGRVPKGATMGDFNSDGVADLAVVNRDDNTVSVLLGRGSGGVGNGAFAAAVDFPVGQSPFAVVSGDFNRDGMLDLAAANGSGGDMSVSILLGQGTGRTADGSFATKLDSPVGSMLQAMTAGNFNGDEFLDLALATPNMVSHTPYRPGKLTVLNGQGAGAFAVGQTFTYQTSHSPQQIIAGDFSGDGTPDVAVLIAASNWNGPIPGSGVFTHLGLSTGGLSDGVWSALPSWPVSAAAGDFDDDGVTDLAVTLSAAPASAENDGVAIYLGAGDGTFTSVTRYDATYSQVAAGDFNGDGITDLALSIRDPGAAMTNRVSILLGQGTGGVGDGTFAVSGDHALSADPSSMATSDFNGDGVTDLAVTNIGARTISTLLGQHGGMQAFSKRLAVAPAFLPGGEAGAPAASLKNVAVVARFSWPDAPAAVGPTAFPIAMHIAPRAPAIPASWRRLSAPYRVVGDQRLQRIATFDAPGFGRLQVQQRLGARVEPLSAVNRDRQGLLLADDCGAERLLLVNLPILDAASPSGDVRVWLTTNDWMRAPDAACVSELPACAPGVVLARCDPFGAQSFAQGTLPRIPHCNDGTLEYEDLVVPRVETLEILPAPDGDLGKGCGRRRFVVNTDDPTRPVVQILTDRLGTIQAFVR